MVPPFQLGVLKQFHSKSASSDSFISFCWQMLQTQFWGSTSSNNTACTSGKQHLPTAAAALAKPGCLLDACKAGQWYTDAAAAHLGLCRHSCQSGQSGNPPVPAPPPPPPQSSSGKLDARVTNLLQEFPEIFCQPAGPTRPSHGVEHVIETTGRPVFAKPRRLDPDKLQAAKTEFSKLEAAGIIRCSDSPWSSPLHMVHKKDGGW